MASSQVEIVLTSPFGCVLRKYNHRERFRETASSRVSSSSQAATFQNSDRRNFVDKICNNNDGSQVANNNNLGFAKKENKEDESLSPSSNNNNNFNPRQQSQILDRWAARKAKEMVSTIETEAELLENMGSSSNTSTSSSSSETILNNRGASSLVQIWEKRLNNLNPSSPLKCNTVTSRTSSFGSSDVGEIFTVDETSSSSSYSDWVVGDTNTEATTCSTPKVADLIKRLKDNKYEQSNNNIMMMGSSGLSSSRSETSPVVPSPRIRGRRAFTDLLMQMERDRHGELNNLAQLAPVSNFSQRGRGRIQSLMRLRLLKRHHESTIYEVNRPPKGSSIMHLRERFNAEVKQRSTTESEIVSSRNTRPDQHKNPMGQHGLNPIRTDRAVNVTNDCQIANDYSSAACAPKPGSQTNEEEEEEAHASSSETVFSEAQNIIASQEVGETSTCCNNMVDSSDANRHETKDEADMAEVNQLDNIYGAEETEIMNNSYVDERRTMNNIEEDYHEYASESINDYDHDDEENYYDWMSPIARPRSYWEDRRQAWYKEMLDTAASDNKEEIRQLLERRRVSTLLSSDMRERMDKLMEYHIGTQTQFMSSSQEVDEDNSGGGSRMGQLVSFLQQHIQRHGRNLEEKEEAEKQEAREEEEESLMSNGGVYNETSCYQPLSTQIVSSSSPNTSSWSYRGNEVTSDDSDEDRVDESATCSIQPSPCQSFYQDCRQSSSTINPHPTEMDIIYDMRGQMEQLYREMAEMRKSLKSCIDMQMMLQKSMKREVNNTVREKKTKKKKGNEEKGDEKKGKCCICYEKEVDSVLYRCGHMCTCIKCANELQWNSGKCPICRAPIVDVVRVYVNS
ncbi:hypothetical protein QN277_019406 [Acacia crassicarpa]|uniref:RING-type domain-containing protein n=1 Tax=Acacia crassicarpa TaxID=499986 RepID=A0AAE1MQX9_9FABA|nr:hypothetical protein QN277_019406 [Acacia crassicarpa]